MNEVSKKKMEESCHLWRAFCCDDDGACDWKPDHVYKTGYEDAYKTLMDAINEVIPKIDKYISDLKCCEDGTITDKYGDDILITKPCPECRELRKAAMDLKEKVGYVAK